MENVSVFNIEIIKSHWCYSSIILVWIRIFSDFFLVTFFFISTVMSTALFATIFWIIPRLLDMNISPCYLNPLYQKINTQPVPYSNLLSASKHGLHNLGFRFAFTLLSQLVTCKTMSFSSPLGLIEIWLICEVFRMPEKLYIRLANCSKRLL